MPLHPAFPPPSTPATSPLRPFQLHTRPSPCSKTRFTPTPPQFGDGRQLWSGRLVAFFTLIIFFTCPLAHFATLRTVQALDRVSFGVQHLPRTGMCVQRCIGSPRTQSLCETSDFLSHSLKTSAENVESVCRRPPVALRVLRAFPPPTTPRAVGRVFHIENVYDFGLV